MVAPVIWIAGGVDKGNDYSQLDEVVKDKVKTLICLGKDNGKLIEAFADFDIPIFETTYVSEAIEIADKHSLAGEVVLLSPACASFDLFDNYKDRGDQFEKAVIDLLRQRL